jgi:hypothetical protein
MATALKDTTRVEGRPAINWPTFESMSEVVHEAQQAVADAREVAKKGAERFELAARRRPLAAAGVAAATGFAAGCVLAFGLGWFAARRFGR